MIIGYFKSWIHSYTCKHCIWRKRGYNSYTVSEPWFRIGKWQIWHTIKIACLCGKIFYNIEDL
jgi:hypothetical protein